MSQPILKKDNAMEYSFLWPVVWYGAGYDSF